MNKPPALHLRPASHSPEAALGRDTSQGFTLLEVLVAFFIFSVIIFTLFGSYRAVVSHVDEIAGQVAAREMGAVCLERIRADLATLYVSRGAVYKPPETNAEPDSFRFVGDSLTSGAKTFSRLRFTAAAHLPLAAPDDETARQRAGVAQIVYYVTAGQTPAGERVFLLKRADDLFPYPEFEEKSGDPILCENLAAFSFLYYGPDGEAYETWDSDDEQLGYATPRSVGIQLLLADPAAGGDLADETTWMRFETRIRLPLFREARK